MILFNKYKLIEKIKEGSYGIIYKAENIRTNEFVAIKIESKNENSLLKNEAKIYIYLGILNGFPEVKWFGIDNCKNCLVMSLLGNSLSLLKQKYGKFSMQMTTDIGIQIIKRLQSLHNKGLIHRDIKPDNFVFGLTSKIDLLHIIDFGFCKRYKLTNNKHIVFKKTSNIIGTINYISLNVHKRFEPSRRDDLESAIYIILYLLDLIPWNQYNQNNVTTILEIAELKNNLLMMEYLPNFIKKILFYVRNLRFDETPNYDFLIEILEKNKNNTI